MAMVPDVAAQVQAVAAAAEKPDAVAALGSALTGLGQAYVTFGQAILAIDMKKVASGDAGKKKKAAKPKSDKPPRAPSAYNLYVKDKSAELRATGKHANQQDLMRELGVMWKGLSEHDRQQYTQRAQLGGEAAEAGAGPAAADSDDDDTSKKRKADDSDDEKKEKKKKKKDKKKKKKESSSSSDSD